MGKGKRRTGAVGKKSPASAALRKAASQLHIREIELTPTSRNQLDSIKDERVRKKIAERIDGLERDPDKQG